MVRSRWKTQFDLIESASAFHNKIRTILTTDSLLKSMKCFQEVPVCDLVEGYPCRSHHIDWYVDDLHVVIEAHGRQHYVRTNFGGVSYDESERQFRESKYRDTLKEQALREAGFEFRVVSYKQQAKLDAALLKQIIFSQGGSDE